MQGAGCPLQPSLPSMADSAGIHAGGIWHGCSGEVRRGGQPLCIFDLKRSKSNRLEGEPREYRIHLHCAFIDSSRPRDSIDALRQRPYSLHSMRPHKAGLAFILLFLAALVTAASRADIKGEVESIGFNASYRPNAH